NLRSLGHAVNPYPTTPIDPDTGCNQPTRLTASVDTTMTTEPIYIAVRNDNASRDTRTDNLNVTQEGTGTATPGIDYPVRDVQPAEGTTTAAVTAHPSVEFARDVVADTVNASTVRLVNGKTGTTVGGTVAYDAATKHAVITPAVPLLDNTPYRIVVDGVQEPGGALAPFSSVFSTADTAPQPVGSFDASGSYLAANLSWKVPATTDLDQVIVRKNVGSKG